MHILKYRKYIKYDCLRLVLYFILFFSLEESMFESETTKRNVICCLLELHRRWEWSSDYAPFYWHAAFRMHSTNILHEMSLYADNFSPDIISTTSGGVRRRVTGEQLHDRLTRFYCSLISSLIIDKVITPP